MNPTRLVTVLLAALGALLAGAEAGAHFHIDAPTGGDVFLVGETVTIVWHVVVTHDLENWDLWYSTTGENGPWIPMAIDLPPGDPSVGSVHTHDWVIPDTPSDQVRIRILMDNHGTEEDILGISFGDSHILTDTGGVPTFRRGDVNADGAVDVSDPVYLLSHLFSGGEDPPCAAAADANDDETLDLSDAVGLLSYVFADGFPPVTPTLICGWDPTPGPLECAVSTGLCP